MSAHNRSILYPASHLPPSNAHGPAALPGVVCTYTSCIYHEKLLDDVVGNDKSFHLCGGFVIDKPTLLEWGARLSNSQGLPFDSDSPKAIVRAIDRVQDEVEKYRPAQVHRFGPDTGKGWEEIIITTQSAYFSYALDAENLPQFERGEREKRAEELLKEHGIMNAPFKTVSR